MSISFLEMRRRFQPTPEPPSTYYNSYTPSPSPSSFLQLLPPFRNNYCTRSTILFFCVLIITGFPLPPICTTLLPRFDSFLPSPLPSPPLADRLRQYLLSSSYYSGIYLGFPFSFRFGAFAPHSRRPPQVPLHVAPTKRIIFATLLNFSPSCFCSCCCWCYCRLRI